MGQRLRIATFNLENLDDRPDQEPGLAERIAVLRPQLDRLRADVLLLQEVNGQPKDTKGPRSLAALDRLLRDSAYAGFERLCTTGPNGRGPRDVHNLVILSRLPVLASRQLLNDLVAPPCHALAEGGDAQPVGWDRPVLAAELDIGGGRRLHVVNVHFRAPLAAFLPGQKLDRFAWKSVGGWAEGYFLAGLKRSGQALEVRLLLERLFDAEAAPLVCVGGDFNATLEETPLRLIVAAEEDTGNGHLAGRALIAPESALSDEQRISVIHHGRPQMLDHLLISRALMAHYRSMAVHNEGLGDELVGYAGIEHSPASYHAPVVAEFELPDA